MWLWFRPGCIDFVYLFLRQLQFAAGDAEGQHELLLGGLSFGALALEIAVINAADYQADRDGCNGGPAQEGLREDAQPGSSLSVIRGGVLLFGNHTLSARSPPN